MTLLADVNHQGSQECMVSYWEPAHYLVEDVASGAKTAIAPCLLSLAITYLSASGDGGPYRGPTVYSGWLSLL